VNANQEYIDILRKVPRILCERYELFDVLGKGAHGRIYLSTDLVTHERVAIKLVSNFFECRIQAMLKQQPVSVLELPFSFE